MRKLASFSIFFLLTFYSIGQLYVPKDFYPSTNKETIVHHTFYSLSYVEEYEQPEWVAYVFTSQNEMKNVERTDDFREDPLVSSGSSTLADYVGSGFDRGHLVPAGSMAFNELAMSETFYMSNISPQDPSFNRGIWKKLESQVRDWYNQKGNFLVIAGGLFDSINTEIGPSGVDIPHSYFKVVFDYDGENQDVIGFIIPNRKGEKELSEYVVTVDFIESQTGLDFFQILPDEKEDEIESRVDKSNWTFGSYGSSSSQEKRSESVQCLGIAKSTGNRCRKRTLNQNGYCHLHQSQVGGSIPVYTPPPIRSNYSGRCQATTQAGSQCKRNASNGSRYCWQHK